MSEAKGAVRLDWEGANREALGLFKDLLRLDTTNPPGGELPAVELLARSLAEDGVEGVVWEVGEGRGNMVARLKATAPSGAGPLLLTGHVDVVPADESRWRHPPFGAVEEGGYLYGRGAVDMKNMVAMSAMVVKLLARAGVARDRDVIFAAVSDEEEGCRWGSQWLVEQHPEAVRAEYMVGEIGGFPMDVMGARFYPVQVAEKGMCWMRLVARGEPGHGSMPWREAATHRLVRAAGRVAGARLPQHVTGGVEGMLRTLAAHVRWPVGVALKGLLTPAVASVLLPRLKPAHLAKSFGAMLSNTVAVTRLEGGDKLNTIPAEAAIYLDGRTLPGQTPDDLIREVRAVIADPTIEVEVIKTLPPVETTADGPLYASIVKNLGVHDPNGVPLPYMIPGFTDAKFFSQLGARCFGFSPLRWPVKDKLVFSELFHGHNERIHVKGFTWGLRVLFDTVTDLIAPRG